MTREKLVEIARKYTMDRFSDEGYGLRPTNDSVVTAFMAGYDHRVKEEADEVLAGEDRGPN